MNRYALVTEWQLRAPIDRVWDALYDVAAWPGWWKYVRAVEELEKGDAAGVGARGVASRLGAELLAG